MQSANRPTGASAADGGVRPTIYAEARQTGKVSGIGLKPTPPWHDLPVVAQAGCPLGPPANRIIPQLLTVAVWMVSFGLLLPLCWGAQDAAQDADLLTTVWNGVRRAQKDFTSGCGKIVETRTSLLLARPMVFRGKFCAAGLDRFWLEYTEPEPVRLLFNKDYLNVTTDGGRKTEVMDVGGNVRRTQAYFSHDNSLPNLQKNFEIAVSREPGLYVMKMTPRTERFRRKISQIVVKVDAAKFLLRSLEVDGKSGVTSVFRIEMTSLNSKIPDGTFDVYRPK